MMGTGAFGIVVKQMESAEVVLPGVVFAEYRLQEHEVGARWSAAKKLAEISMPTSSKWLAIEQLDAEGDVVERLVVSRDLLIMAIVVEVASQAERPIFGDHKDQQEARLAHRQWCALVGADRLCIGRPDQRLALPTAVPIVLDPALLPRELPKPTTAGESA